MSALVFASGAAGSAWETVVLDCEPRSGVDICRSHFVIDGAAKTADWYYCEPGSTPGEPEQVNVEMTAGRITFDDMGRHDEFDRRTWLFTLTETASGERFESICTTR